MNSTNIMFIGMFFIVIFIWSVKVWIPSYIFYRRDKKASKWRYERGKD
jgi:hypothetical protein